MARVDAFFLPLAQGERFCLLHRTPVGVAERGAVLFVHPFAEEMNNARRMAALQSRAFADAGWTVLQIDLFGCGDSAGDFAEASWSTWIDDVIGAARWLSAETGRQPVLWGLRAGCLLAAQAGSHMSPAPDLLMWQPVTSGRQCLQQFLRLRLARGIVEGAESERHGTRALHDRLARGETIEIGGYALAPALAIGMGKSELEPPARASRMAWLEVSRSRENSLPPASHDHIRKWRDAGHRADVQVVAGPAFWQLTESGECPALISATLEAANAWQQ